MNAKLIFIILHLMIMQLVQISVEGEFVLELDDENGEVSEIHEYQDDTDTSIGLHVDECENPDKESDTNKILQVETPQSSNSVTMKDNDEVKEDNPAIVKIEMPHLSEEDDGLIEMENSFSEDREQIEDDRCRLCDDSPVSYVPEDEFVTIRCGRIYNGDPCRRTAFRRRPHRFTYMPAMRKPIPLILLTMFFIFCIGAILFGLFSIVKRQLRKQKEQFRTKNS